MFYIFVCPALMFCTIDTCPIFIFRIIVFFYTDAMYYWYLSYPCILYHWLSYSDVMCYWYMSYSDVLDPTLMFLSIDNFPTLVFVSVFVLHWCYVDTCPTLSFCTDCIINFHIVMLYTIGTCPTMMFYITDCPTLTFLTIDTTLMCCTDDICHT